CFAPMAAPSSVRPMWSCPAKPVALRRLNVRGRPDFDTYRPLFGDSTLPLENVASLPARYPTAARTEPPVECFTPPGAFTTTSVTKFANSHRPYPTLPAHPPVGSRTLRKCRPASVERNRPMLEATYTIAGCTGSTATW